MIKIEQRSQGVELLALLAQAAEGFLRELLSSFSCNRLQTEVGQLRRTIVHTDPHLDEYLADLLLRVVLPPDRRNIAFEEQALFTQEDDWLKLHTWPQAAVIGFGANAHSSAKPLLLFDEHIATRHSAEGACCRMVVNAIFNGTPSSMAKVVDEICFIDEFANAHSHHLSKIIKSLHETRFALMCSPDDSNTSQVFADSSWKRCLVNLCIVGIIYCLECGKDVDTLDTQAKEVLSRSFKLFCSGTPLRNHPEFSKVSKKVYDDVCNIPKTARDAVLKRRSGNVLDQHGKPVPQLLVMHRILSASEHAWGRKITDVIGLHLWEVQIQSQLDFERTAVAVEHLLQDNLAQAYLHCSIGSLEFRRLQSIEIVATERDYVGKTRQKKVTRPVWLFHVRANPGVIKPNRAIVSYINDNNCGSGLVLLEDPSIGTKALFRAANFPEESWCRLCQTLCTHEEQCWYHLENDDGRAPFILNGNKAHRYVPQSTIGMEALAGLVGSLVR